MADRETVIRNLEYLINFGGVSQQSMVMQIAINALALLKEQDAVKPIPPMDESDLWRCGNCNHQLFRCTHQRYCEMCGRKVKWNEIN